MIVEAALVGAGACVGWLLQKRRSVDYRRRWREALALVANEREEMAESYSGLSPPFRVQIEMARLRAGKPPRDTLEGLPDWALAKIETTRLHTGWDRDENGDWVREGQS